VKNDPNGYTREAHDLLTAQDIQEQYGLNATVTESLMRNLGKRGLLVRIEGFRRDFVRRGDLRIQSGGTTWE
jgi:predicted transcriptional regulator of viral defense system